MTAHPDTTEPSGPGGAPTPPDPLPGPGWEKDSSHMAGPITPFGGDLLATTGDAALAEMCRTWGLIIDGLDTRIVGGEVYARVLPAVGSPDASGAPPPAWLLGVLARVLPPLRRRMRAAREAVEGGLLEAWPARWQDEVRPRLITRTRDLLPVDLATLDDEALAAHAGEVRSVFEEGTRAHFLVFIPYNVAVLGLERVADELLGWDLPQTVELLGSPASHATRGLDEVRAAVAADPAARAALEAAPTDPVAGLRRHLPAAADALAAWLDAQGWRTTNYDAGAPALVERPELVTTLVLAPPDADADARREERAGRARARLDGDERARFDEALDRARRTYPTREDTVVVGGEVPGGLLRRWLLEAGRRLGERGLLDSPDDAPWLHLDELLAALAGEAAAADLATTIERRRAEWAWVAANPGPTFVGEPAPPPDVSRLPAAGRLVNEAILWAIGHEYPGELEGSTTTGLLHGAPGSSGTHRGPARVVLDEDGFDAVEPGDVLVCPVTSPAWSVLFSLAGAVVTDAGGVLSHAAVVAREHGIPAVLGTAEATRTVRTGERVEVDGDAGTVRLVDRT